MRQEHEKYLPLKVENGMIFADTTDGKHICVQCRCVCGVYHMKYLGIADRLGRNFCNACRDLCSAGRFLSHEEDKKVL